jgi:hypothetical protein
MNKDNLDKNLEIYFRIKSDNFGLEFHDSNYDLTINEKVRVNLRPPVCFRG